MGLTDELKSRAHQLGFVAVGVTTADPFVEAQEASIQRTDAGLMDGLSWWSRERAETSAEPKRRTPQARSVVALAFPHPVPPPGGTADDGPRGRIAAYALGRDYHELLEERMTPLVDLLKERGAAKTYVDHGWMLDRRRRLEPGWAGWARTPTCWCPAAARTSCWRRSSRRPSSISISP